VQELIEKLVGLRVDDERWEEHPEDDEMLAGTRKEQEHVAATAGS
jgi:hypothetical protein